ncbi:hypothetical protein C8J57DRAFT_431263 [Mycena rebaudengoi]|nr:hypothetical protein C8J57DRAFT_431263 [Mycena rebaudengoi]
MKVAFFANVFAVLSASVFISGNASPVGLEARDVFVPPILTPRAGTVWTVGQTQHVTWDVTNPPKQITNGIGRIMLRKGELTTPVILADNFSILLGKIKVKVPWVVDGDDYALVLFGDSGNFSGNITIKSA